MAKCFNDGAIAGISMAGFVVFTLLGTLVFNKSCGGGHTPSGMGVGGLFIDILLGLFLGAVLTIALGVSLALSC